MCGNEAKQSPMALGACSGAEGVSTTPGPSLVPPCHASHQDLALVGSINPAASGPALLPCLSQWKTCWSDQATGSTTGNEPHGPLLHLTGVDPASLSCYLGLVPGRQPAAGSATGEALPLNGASGRVRALRTGEHPTRCLQGWKDPASPRARQAGQANPHAAAAGSSDFLGQRMVVSKGAFSIPCP